MSDKYTKMVRYLTDHPDEIELAWSDFGDEPQHGCHALFQYVTKSGTKEVFCGCLTQIRSGEYAASIPELTEQIRNDTRIPKYSHLIRENHLPVFAEWQRKIDKVLGRCKTKLD